jgi:hypothetical protein
LNEIWQFKGRRVKIQILKSLEHAVALWVIAFSPMYKQYPMYEGYLLTIFSSQMESVQTIFHYLNIHFITHGQDPPKKGQKIQWSWA